MSVSKAGREGALHASTTGTGKHDGASAAGALLQLPAGVRHAVGGADASTRVASSDHAASYTKVCAVVIASPSLRAAIESALGMLSSGIRGSQRTYWC